MTLLQKVEMSAAEPQTERPDPEKVIAGDPVHTTWLIDDRAPLYAGIWRTTPGSWKVDYAEWEYIRILEGHSTLTDEAGNATDLRAGDSFSIRPGFRGTWTCHETTVKDFVILE